MHIGATGRNARSSFKGPFSSYFSRSRDRAVSFVALAFDRAQDLLPLAREKCADPPKVIRRRRTAKMQLGLTPKTIKYLMFAFNLFFVITGIILLSIGLIIHGIYYQYQHFLDNSFLSVPSLLVAVGIIVFIIAFFGCCGAVRESPCMIITFCTLLTAVFILEIIGGTMGYVMRTQVAKIAESKMLNTMSKYNNSQEIQLVWDNLQHEFECCGTRNASDWTKLNITLGIPMSCCDRLIGAIGQTNCTVESPTLHHLGCIDAFANFAEKHAAKIAGVGLTLAAIQLIGIFLSSYLARSIRNTYETM